MFLQVGSRGFPETDTVKGGVNEGWGHRPSWPGGVAATSNKYRVASKKGADGVVVQIFYLCLNNHPVCACWRSHPHSFNFPHAASITAGIRFAENTESNPIPRHTP